MAAELFDFETGYSMLNEHHSSAFSGTGYIQADPAVDEESGVYREDVVTRRMVILSEQKSLQRVASRVSDVNGKVRFDNLNADKLYFAMVFDAHRTDPKLADIADRLSPTVD